MSIEPKTLSVRRGRIEGEVHLDGAKNSALRLLAASLLSASPIELTNYPAPLLDTQIHVGMLEELGKSVEKTGPRSVRISEDAAPPRSVLEWQGRSIRNTLLILGALTGRTGRASVPLPGGCRLGERKYDLHVHVLESLGARVWDDAQYLHAEAPVGGLVGNDIHLRLRSTGATENAILSAVLAKGVTRVWNPHVRPEILDLVAMLNSMGAQITVHGQEHIEIVGVEELAGTSHRVIPDNMEAITWLTAASVTGGEVEIFDFPHEDLQSAVLHLKSSGAEIFTGRNSVIVRGGDCYPFEISTGPHPGINSDVQPILAAWAAKARGESRIVDLRFRGRYDYAAELGKMGVESVVDGDMLRITGRDGALNGATVRALDLRAGAALALCGLMAEGETVIEDAWQIARGYVGFAEKLQSLGADAEWGF